MRKVLKRKELRGFQAWKERWSDAKQKNHKIDIAVGRMRHRMVSKALASFRLTARLRVRARQLLKKFVARYKQRELSYGFLEWRRTAQQGSFDEEKA